MSAPDRSQGRRVSARHHGIASALVLAATLARAAVPGPVGHGADLAERLDRVVRIGGDSVSSALASLDAMPAPADAAGRRALALARAEILARGGNDRDGDAAAAMGEAVLTAAALAPALAEADGHYLRALQAERDGHSQLPALAGGALTRYDAYCAALVGTAPATPCEYRTRWRLHQLLGAQALARQQPELAHRHAHDALTLAQAAGDTRRQAGSECLLAQHAAAAQDPAALHQHLELAASLARRSADPALQVQVTLTEATTLPSTGDSSRLRALLNQALAAAQRAGATRLEAGTWANLSDLALREGRAREALQAASRGLALSRPLGAHRITRVLEANALLARVYLGQAPAARQELERLMAAWAAAGDSRAQLSALRHFGDALAATGDWAGALAMHHRERALGQELHAAAREATLAELRGRYDHEAQQRSIVMQARDNAVKAAALENRALTQWLWMLGGGVLALALLLVGLLASRARAANRALARNQHQLRQQSEHDALTGLINRRHLQALLQSRRSDEQFQGALLLLDIDHFKQVNDRHGHAAGDAVLVTLARRLSAALPDGALAARWGGEEFLVALPGDVTPGAVRALARQLLQAVAAQPVPLPDGPALAITTSIGHARFPLPKIGQAGEEAGGALPLGLTRAIHLVDMALYLAKTQGRHRAVGVTATAAPDIEALRLQEADLERAAREGRVRLDTDLGPEPPARHPAAALPPPARTVPA